MRKFFMFKNGTIVDINDVATIIDGGYMCNTISVYLNSMHIKSPQTFNTPIVLLYNNNVDRTADLNRFMEEASK
jgi:hypothetical protein